MKKNGQALVEFIIILPILIIILLGIIDFGLIFMKQNTLENNLEEVTNIWTYSHSIDSVNEYLNELDEKPEFVINEKNKSYELTLISDYNVVTPGLNLILDNPYKIKVSRVMYNG